MKGRQILIEPLPAGGHAAALMVDGRLEDLLVDPDPADPAPRPEAIYRAVPARPMKGLGGVIVDLGGGQLRLPARADARRRRAGRCWCRSSGWAEPGKAPPVTARLLLKGRCAILTPGAPGINVARVAARPGAAAPGSRRSPRRRWRARRPELGLILRSAAAAAGDAEIAAEIAALRARLGGGSRLPGPPGRLRRRAGRAGRGAPGVARGRGGGARGGDGAGRRRGLGGGGGARGGRRWRSGRGRWRSSRRGRWWRSTSTPAADLSPAAALKANLAAAAELPRQLRLRGLGGQVTIDFAPLARADRPRVERALGAALRGDGIDTTIVGWTPLGHLELQRKRARRPLRG